jgi:hypothetical protein
MQKTAQDSQQKSGNLKVYAFEVSRINAATLALKLRMLGGLSSVRTIAISEIPNILSQIDSALADGVDKIEINVGSGVCAISPVLLKNLKTSLSSYHAVSGGSGAQVVRKGVSTPVKSKAPARAVSSAARKNLISQKDTRANSDVELENTAHTARVSADFENQLARIVGDELRKAVMPLLAEIDAIAALVKECAAELAAVSKKFTTRVLIESEKRDRRIAKASAVRAEPFNGSGTAAEGSISTRGGRTSVVVGRRKVS